ncbi:MAG: CDP-alcohol phosphatidyltransferase family protein [Methylocaldum sp.]|nr:CDP-alcohol phosphatidyltransferase family protein [Methylocaldum sp.]
MPSIYQLKPLFQQSLSGIVRKLAAIGVTANQITVLAAALSVALGAALAWFPQSASLWLSLPVFLFVRMALNAIDGMLARQYGQQSALGGLLNEAGDLVSDAALYLAFAILPGVHAWLAVAVVLLAWLTEFVGVCAVTVGASRRYDGPMGKSDRAFVFGACGLVIGLGLPAASWLNVVLTVVALLSLVTVLNRARALLKEVQWEAQS